MDDSKYLQIDATKLKETEKAILLRVQLKNFYENIKIKSFIKIIWFPKSVLIDNYKVEKRFLIPIIDKYSKEIKKKQKDKIELKKYREETKRLLKFHFG